MTSPAATACAESVVVGVSRLRRRIREVQAAEGLTPSQRSVLSRLDKDGAATASELAVAERVRQQSMGATVAVLLELELVQKADDPSDGRRKVLSLTEQGAAWTAENRSAKQGWLATALDETCTPDELATVTAAMAILDRVAGR